MATQWHPLFVLLLRPLVEDCYEVKTGLEVGDAPREADLVLLRRNDKIPHFTGIWRYLTPWNILEYKGPSVSARLEHVDLLVELGLGIERRLNELGAKEKQKPTPPGEVSFWYLTHKIGRRFLKQVTNRLEKMERIAAGIWSCSILTRPIFLVSVTDLPVEQESAVFHLLHSEPEDKGLAALRLTLPQPSLWDIYRPVFENLHPEKLKEVIAMAKSKNKGPVFHVKAVADFYGMDKIIAELGEDKLIDEIGLDKIIDRACRNMNESERAELKRRIREADRKKNNQSPS